MLRDKNLIPLSRQHQHALALCVRIDRASPICDSDLEAWQAEIAQQFDTEIGFHFAAEERVLFPAARKFADLNPLLDELFADHAALRQYFQKSEARQMSAHDLTSFARTMSAHIRKEERQLFECLQELMTQEEFATVGRDLENALKDAVEMCSVTTGTTKLRSKKSG